MKAQTALFVLFWASVNGCDIMCQIDKQTAKFHQNMAKINAQDWSADSPDSPDSDPVVPDPDSAVIAPGGTVFLRQTMNHACTR